MCEKDGVGSGSGSGSGRYSSRCSDTVTYIAAVSACEQGGGGSYMSCVTIKYIAAVSTCEKDGWGCASGSGR